MLNMALLNIMNGAGGGGASDVSNYNIFGLLSPCVNLNACGHWPSSVFIWNKHLTTFQMYLRCQDDCRPVNPRIGVGGCSVVPEANQPRVDFTTPYAEPQNSVKHWGLSTKPFPNGASFRELMVGFIDFSAVERDYAPEINKKFNAHISGYSAYWEHLPPLPAQMSLGATSSMSQFVGGTVWQCGMGTMMDALPAHNNVFFPVSHRTPVIDGVPRSPEKWNCLVVPVRGLTNFPKNEFSNSMMYGFMQLEHPYQIGYGISYSFGVAKDADCLPKKSGVKCGGSTSGNISFPPAPQLFPGFAPFNLDNFLKPFIEAGKLNSYADAANVYADLRRLIWPETTDYGASTYSESSTGGMYKSYQSIWQALLDNWLEQPYFDIFGKIGQDPMYMIRALQDSYTECNFHSIMGCGRSFDNGPMGNSRICAMVDAFSVFKALTTHPEEFPVDLPRLIANI